jgi:carboxyl-terminal processing protease
MTRAPLGPGAILILALLAGGWFLQRGVAQEQNVYLQSRLFQEVVDHIADRYVDPVDRGALFDFAIEGLIRELGDPNTSLLNVEDYENFRIQAEGDYGGVGLEIVERDGYITVVGPIPGSPGARAGIRAGDRIVEVDGTSIRGWPSQQAVQILRGPAGSDVHVRIQRPAVETPIEFTLQRARIQLRSVSFATLLEGDLGYIPLNLFNETSGQEVRAAADSLQAQGARALILDLRGNPGGILEQGIGVADLFLPQRVTVAETRGQSREQNQALRTTTGDRYEGVPLVVLVDRGSASAAEIVAGALQDHDRALVLGSTSFGKGSVQTLFSLSGGNVLKLTTARWYTPAGRSIERAVAPGEGDEDDQPAATASLSLDGQFVVPPDTVGRPTVQSMAGRTLVGGGGIVPDLIVLPDTLSEAEQRAVRALYREAGRYTTGIFNHAVDYLQRNGERNRDFQVTDEELQRLHDRLAEEGFEVEAATWQAAARFIRFQLESEIALQGWGEGLQFQRRLPHDRPLQRAVELLAGAHTQEALFARAGSAPVETRGDAGPE